MVILVLVMLIKEIETLSEHLPQKLTIHGHKICMRFRIRLKSLKKCHHTLLLFTVSDKKNLVYYLIFTCIEASHN